MTGAQEDAVRALLAVLDRENDMLRALQYGALEHMTAEKRSALRALEQAPASDAVDVVADHDANAIRRRQALVLALRGTLGENRRLLKQGMEVQGRIMALIAGAARRGAAPAGYGAKGSPARQTTIAAVALVARA